MSDMRLPIVLLMLVAGCQSSEGLAVRDRGTLEKKGQPVFGRPIWLPGTERVMLPFAIEMDDSKMGGFSMGSMSGGSFFVGGSSGWSESGSSAAYHGGDNLRWNNVAFYDPATGKARLLLEAPAIICRFHARDEKQGPVRGDFLLFGIAMADTNNDGLINAADAVRLYRTSAGGDGLTPITAADTQLQDVNVVGTFLYLRTVRDADRDGKFTPKDVVEVVRVDWNRWGDPQAVVSDELRKQAFDAATRPPSQR